MMANDLKALVDVEIEPMINVTFGIGIEVDFKELGK